MIVEDKKIAENDKAIFYTNVMTTDFKDGYKVVLAKSKKGNKKDYLLLHKGQPIYASQVIDNIWFEHDKLIALKDYKKDNKIL